ncbi:NADP-dependent malic enzyme, chloroplastic-like [Glycine max]|uniref:NADP-dependent malic enzyme, chloroplastic-like n=1 Tax=Glycine max TaxID=3847 RepID=UPI001B357013|nr:NADP-dependent malic enzyme, chloroplastic-like [Glycine max]
MCSRKVIPREAVLMKIRADVDARRESTTITGLIVRFQKNSLQHFKKPSAHKHEPVNSLQEAVKVFMIKPTIMIRSSRMGITFTKEVIEAMDSNNDVKPCVLALSSPFSHSKCIVEEAYQWSEGRTIFASGSPFGPIEYNGKVYTSSQETNAYIFPSFGLGLVMPRAFIAHDDMLLTACK